MRILGILSLSVFLLGCQTTRQTTAAATTEAQVGSTEPQYEVVQTLRGKASWYAGKWHGRLTANGETYNKWTDTAAHKTLPFNTMVRVTNLQNGRSVILRINNRGPYIRGRIIDVSQKAATELDMLVSGVVPCTVEVLKPAS